MTSKFLRSTIAVLLLALVATGVEVALVNSQNGTQTIFIRSDGSVDPSSAPIKRNENTYTFTGDAYSPLVVQKAGIVIDGAGHTIQGEYNGTKTDSWMIGDGSAGNGTEVLWTIGLDLAKDTIGNLTIKNLNIKNFSIGMYLWTPSNTVTGNTITQNIVGILLSGNGSAITKNQITDNEYGVFFGSNNPGNVPANVEISLNSFVNNTIHLSGCVCKETNTTETPHTWDNGKEGNYWADYNGTDQNKDGIGDSPYSIDPLNIDRYPLMQKPATNSSVGSKTSIYETTATAAAITIVAVIAVIVVFRRCRKRTTPKETKLTNC